MKKIVTLLLAFVFNLSIAQIVCGTSHSVNPELEKMIAKRITAQRQSKTSNANSLCINVHFKIVRPSNATDNTPPAYLDDIIEKLNKYYNPHKIFFNSIGYEYINNSKYLTLYEGEQYELFTISKKANAINYYIVENLWQTPDGIVTGVAGGIPANALAIGKNYIFSSTSPHEVGHC